MEIHKILREKLNMMVENKKIPHIIFHGPSGSGKRRLLDDFIKKIYNDDIAKIKDRKSVV